MPRRRNRQCLAMQSRRLTEIAQRVHHDGEVVDARSDVAVGSGSAVHPPKHRQRLAEQSRRLRQIALHAQHVHGVRHRRRDVHMVCSRAVEPPPHRQHRLVQSPMSYMTQARHVIDVATSARSASAPWVTAGSTASHDDVAPSPSSRLATATRVGGRVQHVGVSDRGLRCGPTPQRQHLQGDITTDSGAQ
jgi:hypothetical protein